MASKKLVFHASFVLFLWLKATGRRLPKLCRVLLMSRLGDKRAECQNGLVKRLMSV